MKKFIKFNLLLLIIIMACCFFGCNLFEQKQEDNLRNSKKAITDTDLIIDELVGDEDVNKNEEEKIKVINVVESDIFTELPDNIDDEMYSVTGEGYYAFGYDNMYYRAMEMDGNYSDFVNLSKWCEYFDFDYISARYRLNFSFDEKMFYKDKVEKMTWYDKINDKGEKLICNRTRISNTYLPLISEFGMPEPEIFKNYRQHILPIFPTQYLEEVYLSQDINYDWTELINDPAHLRDVYDFYTTNWLTGEQTINIKSNKGYYFQSATKFDGKILLKDGKYYQINCEKTDEIRDYFMGAESGLSEKYLFDQCVDKAYEQGLITNEYDVEYFKTYYRVTGNGRDVGINGKFNPATCGAHIYLNVYKVTYTEVQVNIIKNETK